jgi:hypothetical protein
MRQVPLDILGIALDIPFTPPLPRRKADLDTFAAWLCNAQEGLGLRSDQVRLRTWDELFGYEMVGQFWSENGIMVRTADKIRLDVKNARTASDWELVRKLIIKFYTYMDFAPATKTTFSAHVHSKFGTPDEVAAYFSTHPMPQMSARPALFSYVRVVDWEADVRVLIEKSNAFPEGGLFVGWETQFQNNQDWETFIGTLPTVLENSVHAFDLELMR